MKAVNLDFTKLKLRELSRELNFEHGWKMPRGMVNTAERDPATFSRAEWQQARRAGRDPGTLKSLFRECWATSDSKQAFAQALQARGFYLAQGDRRGAMSPWILGARFTPSRNGRI